MTSRPHGSLLEQRGLDPPVDAGYRRQLGLLDLTGIGIAAIVGAGIFVLLAVEARTTGPAVVASLLLGGAAAALAALSYAESASILPRSGSAYAFTFAAFGSLPAFLVGWLFVDAYAIGNAGVAVGWADYIVQALKSQGIDIPRAVSVSPFQGGVANLPAVGLVVVVTWLSVQRVRAGLRVNNLLVALKLLIVVLVIGLGAFYVKPGNWQPFAPAGLGGIAASTAILFFAYLGFDTIAAAGAEAKRPRRDLPIAILLSVAVATGLYALMAGVVTGMAGPDVLAGDAPIASAFALVGHPWAGAVITAGALVALGTVAYAFQIAMARILQAMASDGFMPRYFAVVAANGVPIRAAVGVGVVTAISAAFLPLDALIESGVEANVAIFAMVSLGILALRRVRAPPPDAFRAPAALHVAAVVALVAVVAFGFGALIHMLFVAWLAAGLAIYGFWGHRSSLRSTA